MKKVDNSGRPKVCFEKHKQKWQSENKRTVDKERLKRNVYTWMQNQAQEVSPYSIRKSVARKKNEHCKLTSPKPTTNFAICFMLIRYLFPSGSSMIFVHLATCVPVSVSALRGSSQKIADLERMLCLHHLLILDKIPHAGRSKPCICFLYARSVLHFFHQILDFVLEILDGRIVRSHALQVQCLDRIHGTRFHFSARLT